MPLKKTRPSADINELLRRGAKQLLKEADQIRKEAEQRGHEYEVRANVCVEEKTGLPFPGDPLKEPCTEWHVIGSMPFDLPKFVVRVRLSDAVRNKQSVRELLARRWRRGYRERLLVHGIAESDNQSAKMSQLVDFHIVDPLKELAVQK